MTLSGKRGVDLSVDWVLFFCVLALSGAGLVTMYSFSADNPFFERQVIWLSAGVVIFFIFSFFDFRFLRRSGIVFGIYAISIAALLLLFVLGEITLGAQSRFAIGAFAVQPADFVKLAVILLLAKYFSRRHMEIRNVRHILVSGFYAFVVFVLVFLQPDFGSAIIIGFLWLAMVFASGISKKHLAAVFLIGAASFAMLWFYIFQDYQKERILTFLNPLTDLEGAGYNAYQSTIAVGSGQLFGKGLGYGTQSKLQFLPEYETDFIFAAFAEEWGFIGIAFLFVLFGVVIFRVFRLAFSGASNFETLFAVGVGVLFMSQFAVHVGMNIGLLPVTGVTLPFLSYGGSHLITEFAALGILMGMRRYARTLHPSDLKKEFVGAELRPSAQDDHDVVGTSHISVLPSGKDNH